MHAPSLKRARSFRLRRLADATSDLRLTLPPLIRSLIDRLYVLARKVRLDCQLQEKIPE
jgi:hypothetical protein